MSDLFIDKAVVKDVPAIATLLRFYSDKELLLPRTEENIYESLLDFYVIRDSDKIIACGALLIFNKDLGEIRSLAVDEKYAGMGLGSDIVGHIQNIAIDIGLGRLIALTYVEKFFEKLGYKVVDMNTLPEKVWSVCINCPKFRNCDEIAVMKHLTPATK